MRLDAFIAAIATDLEKWVAEQGGKFHVARDPLHPYVILAGGSFATYVVILSYLGSQALNTDSHPHGMRSAKIELFIGHPMDLRTEPGAWLFRNDGASHSILKQLDDLQAHILTIAFDNGEKRDKAYAEFGGDEQATLPDGTPLKAFKFQASWPIPITINESDYRFLN